MVAASHGVLSALLGITGVATLLQARVNLLWETTFYGHITPISSAIGLAGLVFLVLATLSAGSGLIYALRLRFGPQVMLFSSCVLAVALPPPLVLLVVASAVLAIMDLWSNEPPQERPSET